MPPQNETAQPIWQTVCSLVWLDYWSEDETDGSWIAEGGKKAGTFPRMARLKTQDFNVQAVGAIEWHTGQGEPRPWNVRLVFRANLKKILAFRFTSKEQ